MTRFWNVLGVYEHWMDGKAGGHLESDTHAATAGWAAAGGWPERRKRGPRFFWAGGGHGEGATEPAD
jgi:hypothetical protein